MTYNNPLNTRTALADPNAMIDPDAVRDNVIEDLRTRYRDRLLPYTNKHLAQQYRAWRVSEDYPDEELFINQWLPSRVV